MRCLSMARVALMVIGTGALSCGGTSSEKVEPEPDPDETADTPDEPPTEDTDLDTEDTDLDTEDTGGAGQGTPIDSSCDSWAPLETRGWTREYQVELLGQLAVESQQGWGLDLTTQGEVAFHISSSFVGTADQWSGSLYYLCDDAGVRFLGWDGAVDTWVTTRPSEPPLYLPPVVEMGQGGAWSYDYELVFWIPSIVGSAAAHTVGTTTEVGFESITVPAGTFDNAYRVTHTYTQALGTPGIDLAFQETSLVPNDISVVHDQWFVDGLGLVYELAVGELSGDTLHERRLSHYVGIEAR